jgi:hypothetical protein
MSQLLQENHETHSVFFSVHTLVADFLQYLMFQFMRLYGSSKTTLIVSAVLNFREISEAAARIIMLSSEARNL